MNKSCKRKMRSLQQILIIIVCSYLCALFVISNISIPNTKKYTTILPNKEEYCGGEYYIEKGKDVVCSKEFNNKVIIIDENINIICGEYVMTKNSAYKIKDENDAIIIDKTSSGTKFVEIINGSKSEYTINHDLSIIDNSFRMSIKNNRIFYYACSDHCVNEHFCKINVYYIE